MKGCHSAGDIFAFVAAVCLTPEDLPPWSRGKASASRAGHTEMEARSPLSSHTSDLGSRNSSLVVC